MIRILLVLFLSSSALFLPSGARAAGWLDQSHDVFLTQKLTDVTSRYREFPVFWWNFVVIEGPIGALEAEQICRELHLQWAPHLSKMLCNLSPEQMQKITQDWITDLPRRRDLPSPTEWQKSMNSLLTKASMPLPRDLLNLMRADPLNTLTELKDRLDERRPFNLPMQNGMVVDESTNQRWLPVQLNYAPMDSQKTAQLLTGLKDLCPRIKGCHSLELFGPHASTLENERRIRDDIDVVAFAGSVALALLALFVLATGRYRLVFLLPILLLGLLISALSTIFMFGKIHGITLAFGPGIVGLAMDYGIHAVFLNPRSRSTWRSNLAGLLTTLVILLILIFSEIPLLRQLAFFSSVGLCVSFLLFFVCLHLRPHFFETKPYLFSPKTSRLGKAVALIMLASSPLVFLLPLNLSVQHLNYESERTEQHRQWLMRHSTSLLPYWLEEDPENPLASAAVTKTWAESQGIGYEGIAAFLPPIHEQAGHLKTWDPLCGPGSPLKLTPVQERFFAPYFEKLPCGALNPHDLTNSVPDYLRDFGSRGRWASLLFTTTPEQTAALKNQFPQATTPREVFAEFPRIFVRELSWMVPVALMGALILLFAHFRNTWFTFLAVVPFLTGLGAFAIVATFFHLPLSFISLIGLLMVFGFSLDYGIFVMDLMRGRDERRSGVWSALGICSFSTVAGFAPLVFAGHPVLNDLGHALLWGSIGTFIGTFWGIPGLFAWRKA